MSRKPMATRKHLHVWSVPEIVIGTLAGVTFILMSTLTIAVLMGY